MTNDDFLTQVQKTEAQAKDIIAKAHSKAKTDLETERRKQEEALNDKLKKERNLERDKLKTTQNNARNLYEELTMQGKQDAKKLKTDMTAKCNKTIPAAEVFLLNDVL